MHMPHLHLTNGHLMHDSGVKINHMVHDERFWLIVTLAILGGLITLSVWAGIKGGGMDDAIPLTPYFPY